MKIHPKILLITILFVQNQVVDSQKIYFNNFNNSIYYEALKIHITNIVNDSLLPISYREKTQFYVYENCTIDERAFTSIVINGINITLKIIDNSEIIKLMKSKDMDIIYINPIKIEDYIYIDITDFGIEPIKGNKRFNFVDSGGTRIKINYDCNVQKYYLESLTYE